MLISLEQENDLFLFYPNALIQREYNSIDLDVFNTVARVFNAQVCTGMVINFRIIILYVC